jgi:hypothetical protein
VKVGHSSDNNDSFGSTPKSEGGLSRTPDRISDKASEKMAVADPRFVIIEKEQVKEETEIKKPHNKGGKKKKVNSSEIHLLGQYEIVREDEEITPSTGGSNKNNL